jgi:hypothetical protein
MIRKCLMVAALLALAANAGGRPDAAAITRAPHEDTEDPNHRVIHQMILLSRS